MNRAAFLLAVLIGAAPGAPAAPGGALAIPVDVQVPVAPRPVLAEGLWHLVYELHLRNFGRSELLLERVEILDTGGHVLLALGGAELERALAHPGAGPQENKRLLPGGNLAVVFLDVTTLATTLPPQRLRQRLTFHPVMTAGGEEQSLLEGASVLVGAAGGPALGPPLRGGCWIASHGLDNNSSHRRTLIAIDGRVRIAQRFAIDWIRIGADGQAFRGDPADNRNWTPYGAEVLAVADGRIAEILDGIPENDPTADSKAIPITLRTVGGNHILLDLGQGRYVFYAHLQPGSLRVRPGQRVRRGQAIARLGNSGQSDAPHLHIHLVDAPSPLAAEGLPLVFDSFLLQGHLQSLRALTDGTGWRPDRSAQVRRHEMPRENAVVRFAGGESPCG